MKYILIIVLAVMWLWSYIKFRRKMKYFSVMVGYLIRQVEIMPRPDVKLRLACALTEIQKYKDAYDIYSELLSTGNYIPNRDQAKVNMEFCSSPIPGINSPKNLRWSWWHNFVLFRLGRRRYNFLTEEDYLATNSILRNM